MNSTAKSPRYVRFGLFEIDLQTHELRKQGRKIKLQEQQGRILSVLLEHAGEVVSREDLRKRLWSEDTFVDFDHSLNTAIMRLREALGDSSDNPIFIEALPRIGYRFLAPVEEVTEKQPKADVEPPAVSPQTNGAAPSSVAEIAPAANRPRTGLWVFGILAIVVLIA